ncbi:DUF397 domain-containing protein [Actinokineospora sp.]|uniref:DUF397 domain-containing protein n=1 Tax=Actinokineospora sp. TaxID=1872133 RepID=UPI0040377CF0
MSGTLAGLVWRKSSRSSGASGDGNTNDCVEVAFAGVVPVVRDSKGGSEVLRLTSTAFAAFLAELKS